MPYPASLLAALGVPAPGAVFYFIQYVFPGARTEYLFIEFFIPSAHTATSSGNDYLQATLDVLRDGNGSVLQALRDISAAYERAEAVHFNDYHKEAQEFERLLWAVPERMWVE